MIHNHEVAGSFPAPATLTDDNELQRCDSLFFLWRLLHFYIIIFGNYKQPDYICSTNQTPKHYDSNATQGGIDP